MVEIGRFRLCASRKKKTPLGLALYSFLINTCRKFSQGKVKCMESSPFGLVTMTNREYHAAPGYSKSHLDKVTGSPLTYWHTYLAPKQAESEEFDEPTNDESEKPSTLLGSAIHTATLEPDLFNSEYIILPELDLRTKRGREERDAFVGAHPGAQILTVDQRKRALGAAAAVRRHPVAGPLLTRGAAEQSFFAKDPETGELIKCRTDFLNESSMVVDLKSIDDASDENCMKSIAKWRYDLQPPWYFDVLKALYGEHPKWWVFVFVESSPPHQINLIYPTPEQIDEARSVARRDFLKILECKRTGVWPDYGTEIKPMQLPAWYRRARGSI